MAHLNSPMPAVASATDTLSCKIFTASLLMSAFTGQGQSLLDSGCSTHITGTKKHFSSYVAVTKGEWNIIVANNIEIAALGEGKVTLDLWDDRGRRERNMVIAGVLHVPECGRNNVPSVSQRCNSGYQVDFHQSGGSSLEQDDGLGVRLGEDNRLHILQTWSVEGSVRALAAYGGEEDEGKIRGQGSSEMPFWSGTFGRRWSTQTVHGR